MSIAHVAPAAVPRGFLPLGDIVDMLSQSGHPASKTTIRSWRLRRTIKVVRCGRVDYYDFSGVLVAHREEVARRARRRAADG